MTLRNLFPAIEAVAIVLCAGLLKAGSLAPTVTPPKLASPLARIDAQLKAKVGVVASYGQLPLHFEPNLGQTDGQVRYVARGGGMTAFFTDTETVMVLGRSEQAVVRMKLEKAGKPRRLAGVEKQPGISNYFIGNDPAKWRTDVPHYGRIQDEGVYPGIDLVWYGSQRQLEYDFVVAPGADATQIQVAYEGVESLQVADGDLILRTTLGELRQLKPKVHQEVGGKRVEVEARYAISARNRVTFELAKYDRRRELRIDPVVLAYSTYLGGGDGDSGSAIAVDAAGSAYITGYTISTNFPTKSPYQAMKGVYYDVFVTKLTPEGNALVYSTYLGGSGVDEGQGIAVDGAGSAYVTGATDSTDFPIQSPYQAINHGGGDVFVTKLTPAGNALVYSTYLGGSGGDDGYWIALDRAGSAYVAGVTSSTDFPTKSPYQAANLGKNDVFVTKLAPAGDALVYSTYLGGSGDEYGRGIAVDGAGAAYVTGYTNSTNFPIQSAYQAAYQGGFYDAFVTKLTPAGDALVYSTYLGGNDYEWGTGIAVDGAGSVYVAGHTGSTNFPIQSAYQTTLHGDYDVFVMKLTPTGGALVYSTYLGGSFYDIGAGIAVDGAGSAYVTGTTQSFDFPTQSPYQPASQGYQDAFVTKLSPAGNALIYSIYLAGVFDDRGMGIAVDGGGLAYVTGDTGSPNFPTQSPYQATFRGSTDAFVTKLGTPTTRVGTYGTGLWILDANGDGVFDAGVDKSFTWGSVGTTPVHGDWNGDGKQKAGFYINGLWYLDYDGNGVWDNGVVDKVYGYGMAGARPVVGDWNGDGKDEIGICINGFWFLDMNGNGVWDGEPTDKMIIWGWSGVTPVIGDWNGNGKKKVGLFYNGLWYLDYDGDGTWDGGTTDKVYGFGMSGVQPMVGDWNGDGKDEIGIYIGGFWFLDMNGNGVWDGETTDRMTILGWTGTTPVVGDWNGDGKTKVGTFVNGYWYLDYNGNGVWDGESTDKAYVFGQAGDTPIVGRW